MSIRPIDMQLVMPKAMETSRTAAAENARPANEQQQFAQQLQRNTVQEQQSVIRSNRTEGQNVDKDGRGNSGGGNSRRRKRQHGDENGQKPDDGHTVKKSLLDISL
ncbi:MAG: hypothetical protein FWE91_01575 [Defluviitaleaceae bacterium]|nr:hypothetical protein [Defluviitaleaceae bacterium]MCL2835729.1 hypothetical protein [Defluviitaleaceae bacterium]